MTAQPTRRATLDVAPQPRDERSMLVLELLVGGTALLASLLLSLFR